MKDAECIAEIRERSGAITKGLWKAEPAEHDEGTCLIHSQGGAICEAEDYRDAVFIANAPTDLKWALDTIEAQAAKIEEYREALRKLEIKEAHSSAPAKYCNICLSQKQQEIPCLSPDQYDLAWEKLYHQWLWKPGEPEKHNPDADGKPCLAAPKPEPGR